MSELIHRSVMLHEAVAGLAVKPDGIYVDGTFGRGGHSAAILAALSAQGRLIALDQDPEAIAAAQVRWSDDARVMVSHTSFAQLREVLQSLKVSVVDGLLLDLGVSSPQLDDASRGFSFDRDGPLDMRMDPTRGISVAEWLMSTSEAEIARVLWIYGEERFSRQIARRIVTLRSETSLQTTRQLADWVAQAMPVREKHKHPATRTFQALRIWINGELDALQAVLAQAIEVLAPGGRLAVISFHSLEDRMVKQFIRQQERGPEIPVGMPSLPEVFKPRLRSVGKAMMPSEEEIVANPRARSAVLRVAERCYD
jgi:16S rRNA (cytosine1402-N4)-methyltransferase